MTNNGKFQNKKEFAPSFGFWPAKSGNGFTVKITDQLLETLTKAQPGGRMLLSEVPADKREENDRLPHYRITIFAPDGAVTDASDSL